MKRPNRDTHKETLTQTDYIWYSKSLEKYIDFLESNQKEFISLLQNITKDCEMWYSEYGEPKNPNYTSSFIDAEQLLTKLKEL